VLKEIGRCGKSPRRRIDHRRRRRREVRPDGYTLADGFEHAHRQRDAVSEPPLLLMRDFVPVAALNYSELVLVVHPSVPAKNLKELIALAKAKPGGAQLCLGGTGHALSHGRRAVQENDRHDIVHVPHKRRRQPQCRHPAHIEMMSTPSTTMAFQRSGGSGARAGTTATTRVQGAARRPDHRGSRRARDSRQRSGLPDGARARQRRLSTSSTPAINRTITRPEIVAAWDRHGGDTDDDDAC